MAKGKLLTLDRSKSNHFIKKEFVSTKKLAEKGIRYVGKGTRKLIRHKQKR